MAVKPSVTLLTGSDMSVINSGPKRKNYSDHSSYSYSGIGPQKRVLRVILGFDLEVHIYIYIYFIFHISDRADTDSKSSK